MDVKTVFVNESSYGKRIDVFICEIYPDFTRSFVHKLFSKNLVSVNDKTVNKHYKLKKADIVSIILPEPEKLDVVAENIPLNIVYEDDQVLVVNKPKGMVVHPAPGHYNGGTLVNAIMWHCRDSLSDIGGVLRPGIVHRIDKDTSGLLVVAKTNFAHISLSEQIKEHSMSRIYEAIAYGKFGVAEGTLNFPIGRSERDRKKMAVNFKNGKEAITHYKVIETLNGFSYLKLKLETGRTHQIRVHMSHIGHPLAGDGVYGPKSCIKKLKGQCLHAKTLGFYHPTLKKNMYFDSELEENFVKFLNCCRNN